ncbi:UDP-N-acetylmuramate dehydrogenase [Lignipirellula cremea]|uniref:UDP-N-acetylenolpyruvoylglucosamine reductase n=1 Tax=Lignipirellula cremea TaxID=2528010 RepID=A0A518DSX5_9BACT|nr:UDP-N-acetylmuramate dehydrogenase [Lignipirellula cremea]QDU94939.1 UDP-N-acetylenolpyruvoylglucosamine reductase MurB [Lignipirellula cremea]
MSFLSGFEHFVRDNEPMAAHTWLRLGGPAEYFAEPTSFEELSALVARCRQEDVPVRLLGGGSNILVRDEGVAGMVVRLAAPVFCDIQVSGDRIQAGAGAKLSHLISTAVREGLSGLEDLVGIPGTVGGALRGNSGGDNSDLGQWTAAAQVLTRSGEILTHERRSMNFAYRQSSLDELVILQGAFQLEAGNPVELTKRMQKIWIEKKANQPGSDQNCGAIFKNPGGVSASSLIEQAGLRNASVGEAEVFDRRPNYLVAHPGASSDDVLRLIDLIRSHVQDNLGVELETAIEVW